MDLWSRRTNSSKLCLSTAGQTGQSESAARTASFSKRFGGDSSSHGKANPFNSLPTPGGTGSAGGGNGGSGVGAGGNVASPGAGGASSAFGLGSGAFASFGSAKTPKSPGNPFDFALGGSAALAKTASGSADKSAAAAAKDGGELNRAVGKQPSSASLGGSAKSTATTSTSTTAPAAALAASGSGAAPPTSHPLRSAWVFWFRPPSFKGNGYVEYEKTLHAMASVASAEEFFAVYAHLKRPSALPLVSDYHLFRKGVRPVWEDDENRSGGKWVVRLKKGVADRYWEDLLLAVIGDQFGDAADEVCGAVLSVRNGEDILSVWTRTDGGRVLKIRETMRRVLAFPPDTKVEWKSHDSSIQQRTALEESRREKGSGHHSDKRSSKAPQQSDDQK